MSNRSGLIILGLALLMMSGCLGNNDATNNENASGDKSTSYKGSTDKGWFGLGHTTKVPAGTTVNVRLGTTITSETAGVGDGWDGVVTRSVVIDGETPIPAGSTVHGVVTGARAAERGNRAMLDLGVRSITANGKTYRVRAGADAVIAGSPRKRNVGAIAGGAAAGALIGKAVGGDGKDAAIGGIIGGATATGVVAASKGYQVVLKSGTVMRFTLDEQIAMK